MIEVPSSFHARTERKETKIDNYNDLKDEILKVWEELSKKVIKVPVIIGVLGCCKKIWK